MIRLRYHAFFMANIQTPLNYQTQPNMKKLLISICLIILCSICYSQAFSIKTTYVTFKAEGDEKWQPSISIAYNIDVYDQTENIVIYNQNESLSFSVKNVQKKNIDGIEIYYFTCVNKDGKSCVLYLSKNAFYVYYDDIQYKYII